MLGFTRFAIAAALVAGASAAQASTSFVTLSNPTVANQFLDLDLGLNFTVTGSIKIDALGAFTNGSSPIAVTLYDVTTGLPVVSATVSGAPAPGSNYAFASIAPVFLTTGTYQINARYSDPGNGNYNPYSGNTATVQFNSFGGRVSFTGDFYNYPGSGTQATTADLLSPNGYGAGTFAVVPEPATWALMIVGFGLVGMARRRAVTVAA